MKNEQIRFRQCYNCDETLIENNLNFYRYKDGSYHLYCKKCLCKDINDFNPLTFIELCKDFNIPYIESEWRHMVFYELQKAYNDKKIYREHSYGTIFGKYLAKMKLKGFASFQFEDSAYLNFYRTDNAYDDYQYIQVDDGKHGFKFLDYIRCIKPPKDLKEKYRRIPSSE